MRRPVAEAFVAGVETAGAESRRVRRRSVAASVSKGLGIILSRVAAGKEGLGKAVKACGRFKKKRLESLATGQASMLKGANLMDLFKHKISCKLPI
jgi:hypothetical protein